MSLAVADLDHPVVAVADPPSYAERARLILLRQPGLFLRPGRGGGLSSRRREPQVQAAARPARPEPRRARSRQLRLPLAAAATGMLG